MRRKVDLAGFLGGSDDGAAAAFVAANEAGEAEMNTEF